MQEKPKCDCAYYNFLIDLSEIIISNVISARPEEGEKSDFNTGRMMAYVEILSIMKQQAEAFGIPLDNIKLDGSDPEGDLLSRY